MIEVESGAVAPLTDSLPSLSLGLPKEEWTERSTASWVNQYVPADMPPELGFDIGSLLSSVAENLGGEPVCMEKDSSSKTSCGQQVTPASPLSPASSSDGSSHLPNNPMPRHKRASHKRAEIKRREKIKTGLDDLRAAIPKLSRKEKLSEPTILSEAAEYTKHLKAQCAKNRTEAGNLRQEIECLSSEIHTFQERLPAGGLTAQAAPDEDSLDQLYHNYVTAKTKENWKFYLFSFFMKPMFDSFKKEVGNKKKSEIVDSVNSWSTTSLGLSNLRRQTLHKMRDLTRETSIMTQPQNLPAEAMASMQQMSARVAANTSPVSLTNERDVQVAPTLTLMDSRPETASFQSRVTGQQCAAISSGSDGSQTSVKSVPVVAAARPTLILSSSLASNHLSAPSTLPVDGQLFDPGTCHRRVTFPVLHAADVEATFRVGGDTTDLVPNSSGSVGATLLPEFDCHEYDYDIADIAFPNLPVTDAALLSPQTSTNCLASVSTSFPTFLLQASLPCHHSPLSLAGLSPTHSFANAAIDSP